MPSLREAATQALEALEHALSFVTIEAKRAVRNDCADATIRETEAAEGKHKVAITALRAALAEPQIDPVDEYRKGFIDGQIDMRDREQLTTEPEQVPVAWADEIIDDLRAQYNTDGIKEIDSGDALIRLDEAIAAVEEAEKRHIAPSQRKPLTEEEIQDCFHAARNAKLGASKDNSKHRLSVVEIARAIERAHGIGGQDE